MGLLLYHAPGSCSDGILFLLAELGLDYDLHLVNLKTKDQLTPDYRAANPKAKVPALRRPDGSVLTEFQAIAFWLGRSHPQAGLIGPDLEDQTRLLEMLDFLVASVHMRGFTLLKVPQKFLSDPDGQAALRAHGQAEVLKALDYLSDRLGDAEFMFGRLSIVDAALFYLLGWAVGEALDIPDNLRALYLRLCDRPAAARVRACR